MLWNSAFSRPSSSFETPVPAPGIDPGAERLLCVSFNERWLPYIIGSLKQLLLNTTFDVPMDSDAFQLVQSQAATLINRFVNATPCNTLPLQGWGGGNEEPMIRQDPANPCLLQSSIDGINWCTFADLSKCLTPSAQPGTGQPQPAPGGGQACYQARLQANTIWNVPTLVSTGDVIEIQNPQGATSNSHNANWYLTSGGQFFGGVDVGFPQTNGANPVPGADIGTLVVLINGTYHSLSGGTFTVPGGVSNASALIQVNDNSLTGLSGELTFGVCVTNNQAEPWESVLDFRTNSYPGIVNSDFGNWVAGLGFESVVNGGDPNFIELRIETGPCTITHMDCVYDCASVGGSGINIFFQADGAVFGSNGTTVAGSSVGFSQDAIASVGVHIFWVMASGTSGGLCHAQKWVIRGIGTKPSILP